MKIFKLTMLWGRGGEIVLDFVVGGWWRIQKVV
jgi:hypothetical protein